MYVMQVIVSQKRKTCKKHSVGSATVVQVTHKDMSAGMPIVVHGGCGWWNSMLGIDAYSG